MDVSEAARQVGVGAHSIYGYIKAGAIPGKTKKGRIYDFTVAEVKALAKWRKDHLPGRQKPATKPDPVTW